MDPHLTDPETGEVTLLPYRFEICHTCQGHGRSCAYLGAYTSDEMADQGPDFFQDYMDGVYDRACDDCDATGKVKVPDYARMTRQQRDQYEEDARLDAEIDAESEAERRMGC